EDILFNNKHFDANLMCLSRFKSIPTTRLLPVHKYIKQATEDIRSNDKLIRYAGLHDTLDKLLPGNIKKQISAVPIITDYGALIAEMKNVAEIHKQSGLILKNIQSYSTEQIRTLCCELFKLDSEAAFKSTHFKRCVMYIDLLENKNK
ncbi:MAG: hypothetical protein IJ274_16925, partial [Lachnospiraceae bacterium]|nr:hypothetical protein [Lachnospiraceae bacterium]